MREPAVVIYERQGPRAALHAMEGHGLNAVFLIARDFTLRGILTREHARELLAQRKESLEHTQVTPVMITEPDAYIEDIIPMSAQTEYPVAVVAGNGSLLGEIRKSALLMGMSDTG